MINYREEEKRILDEILGKGVYDNRIRPSGTNGTGKEETLFYPSSPAESHENKANNGTGKNVVILFVPSDVITLFRCLAPQFL